MTVQGCTDWKLTLLPTFLLRSLLLSKLSLFQAFYGFKIAGETVFDTCTVDALWFEVPRGDFCRLFERLE